MPTRAPFICRCGRKIAGGERCPCQVQRTRDAKARYDATRPSARERGYTSKWDTARADYLKAIPTCRMDPCTSPATVVDHVIPHKGDLKLFWRRSNWQPLCARCHNRRKQSLERRAERVDP